MEALSGKLLRIVMVAASAGLVTLGAVGPAAAGTPGPSVASVRLHVGPGIGGPGSIVAIRGQLPCEQLTLTFKPRTGVSTGLGTVLAPVGRLQIRVTIPLGAPAGPAIISARGANPSLCSGSGSFMVCATCDASGQRATDLWRSLTGAAGKPAER